MPIEGDEPDDNACHSEPPPLVQPHPVCAVGHILRQAYRFARPQTPEMWPQPTAERHSAAPHTSYYLNDGVYGSFNCVMFDNANSSPTCEVLCQNGQGVSRMQAAGLQLTPACLWGPTCDGIDLVLEEVCLPELELGDWLAFPNMGAYTACAASRFNGMALPNLVYLQAEGMPPPASPSIATERMLGELRASHGQA